MQDRVIVASDDGVFTADAADFPQLVEVVPAPLKRGSKACACGRTISATKDTCRVCAEAIIR